MKTHGWTIGAMQFPPALHLDITHLTTKEGVLDNFIKVIIYVIINEKLNLIQDLTACTKRMMQLGSKATPQGAAAIYGKATVSHISF